MKKYYQNLITLAFAASIAGVILFSFFSFNKSTIARSYEPSGFVLDAAGDTGWVSQNSGTTRQLRDVFFINDTIGWAVGDAGTIIKTIDSGDTWNPQASGVTYNLYSVFFISSQKGWAVGCGFNSNQILKTNNGGVTWFTQQVPADVDLQSIQFINPDTGWAAGYLSSDYGVIVNTINGGTTWNVQYVDTSVRIFHSQFFSSASNGWAVGYDNQTFSKAVIYATTNGGSSWFLQQNSIESNYWSVHFADDSVGWVAGNQGVVVKTTDGGANWTIKPTGGTSYFFDCYFVDYFNGWLTGLDGVILRTFDGGETWNPQYSGTSNYLNAIFFVDKYRGWAVGGNGMILFTSSGGGTIGIRSVHGFVPSDFKLYQNYPNPFNPTTIIRFTISELGFTILKVYDALGKEVETLVNEKLSAGSYEVDWDAGDFVSGVYFYRLEMGDYVETRKCLLIK